MPGRGDGGCDDVDGQHHHKAGDAAKKSPQRDVISVKENRSIPRGWPVDIGEANISQPKADGASQQPAQRRSADAAHLFLYFFFLPVLSAS
jgi:hypothetical protein